MEMMFYPSPQPTAKIYIRDTGDAVRILQTIKCNQSKRSCVFNKFMIYLSP